MTEKAMLFDTARCTACKGCQVACKCWNNLPSGDGGCADSMDFKGVYQNPADINGTTRLIMTFNEFEAPESQKRMGWAFGRRSCQHCTDAGCVQICPAGALFRDEETGMITHDANKCVGCQYCSTACPYDVPRYDKIAGRPDPVINKCYGCVDRIHNGMAPACVTTCQPGALQFGDRDEMIRLAHEAVDRLQAKGFTDACVYGEEEMGGLHVIQVLKYGIEDHGQVANPKKSILNTVHDYTAPVVGGVAGLVFLGLAGMTALSAGAEKHDQVIYNPETTDTLDMNTGEVIKHGDGQGTKSFKQYMSQVPIFKKWGEDDHE